MSHAPDTGTDEHAQDGHSLAVRETPGTPLQGGPDNSGYWQRLSPRMLLIHPIRAIRELLPLMVGLVLAGTASGGHHWWWPVVGGVFVLAQSIARWATTSYHLDSDGVQLRHGLASRHTVTARAEQVRSVDLTSPPVHRLLGLAQVRIGTGTADTHVELDGLPRDEAVALRARLLHRADVRPAPDTPVEERAEDGRGGDVAGHHDGAVALDGTTRPNDFNTPGEDRELLRFDPAWVRYGPLRPAGLLAALALFGAAVDRIGDRLDDVKLAHDAADKITSLGVIVAVVVGVVLFVLATVFVTCLGYLLTFWGFRLSQDRAGRSLHLTRGLLTTRATSVKLARVRGVQLREPVPLRWAHAAELAAITTGVAVHGKDEASSSLLAPSAPRDMLRRLGEQIVDAPGIFTLPITAHGPRATRRRWTRALSVGVGLAAASLAAAKLTGSFVLVVLAVALLVAGAALAHDRAKRLGHALTDRHLIIRTGGLNGATTVLERRGVVAVTVRSSVFQRRAGVATVEVATAAGSQSYDILDVPTARANALAAELIRSSSGTTFATASACTG